MNNTEHQLYLHEGSKPATPSEQFVEWGDSINFTFMMMMMMMMNDVHFDIPPLANLKKLQLFHDSGAEQRQGCTELF